MVAFLYGNRSGSLEDGEGIIFQLATELKETAILVGNGDTELCFLEKGK